ncbi:zgc:100814 protein, putative [Brugia malayi]|uniref:Bm5422 n=2 Tax=Brugia TaxID=6278 RepID=A0A0K0JIV1_BRUMA|nr:zgc:100814 protein, putative [Brugia malayi]CDP93606.1 Bm5422 [Brugia malayi]VIO90233.1 zgc:100814 protein, putative [Brugia malayi]
MSLSNTLTGLAACGVSTCLFGSLFVPIKRFNPGDGFFSQWIMCAAIFLVGMIINAYEGFPQFYPLAMLGGILWAIGNAMAIIIFELIGMGMAILIWGIASCLMGWASSRFGLFGLKENIPNSITLNYVGLLLILFGGVLFALIKPTMKSDDSKEIDGEQKNELVIEVESPALPLKSRKNGYEETKLFSNDEKEKGDSMRKRMFGIALSLFAGLFYGLTFVPVIYVQEHPDQFAGAPSEALPYVFAHFTGIFVTGTIILVGYAIIKLNRPVVNHQIILPAFTSGIMWAIAQTSWFIANNYIAQSISFPINSMVPGVIGALWSVIYFKEICGTRNLKILSVAIVITITGAIIVGLSKDL